MFTKILLLTSILIPLSVAMGTPLIYLQPADISMVAESGSESLDSPEPDTLRYDDNGASYFIQSESNYYAFVRFTPPSAFQLRSIYLGIGDHVGSTLPCSVWVCLPNGTRPGEQLALATFTPTLSNQIYDITLEDSVDLEAQQDFIIVIGRVPGYTTGWSPFLDASSTVNRSYITLDDRLTGFYDQLPYDFRIRAGGTLVTFADISAVECFNEVNGCGPAYFFECGDSVLFQTLVRNLSDEPVTAYTISWTVSDGQGNLVFTDERHMGSLDPQTEQIISAMQDFVPSEVGMYTVSSAVGAPGDAVSSNDTAATRLFSTSLPAWFRYDDLEMDGGVVHEQGAAMGVTFQPPPGIAKISEVRVACGMSGNATARVYFNNAQGVPSGAPVWSATRLLMMGWNSIEVSPPVPLPSGESFTVAFVFNGAIALGLDTDLPSASSNTGMGTICRLSGPNGWTRDESGNCMIQAWVDTLTSLPPVAFIRTNPAILDFGYVDTSGTTSRSITLWISNLGNQDTLQVTEMLLLPSNIHPVFSIVPSVAAVPNNDSVSITITFNPAQVRIYDGSLQLANNSFNQPTAVLPIFARGETASPVGDPESALVTGLELKQNYPNPFNAVTQIGFGLSKAAQIRLAIFDLLGRETEVIVQDWFNAGSHTVAFDGKNLPSGLYLCRLESDNLRITRKMILLK